MPFTIAHAAAVLPLMSSRIGRRRWFDATCLVTGAMAPDFEYFLHARMESNLSHTLVGLFVFDVPVALAVAAVFHALVRAPLTLALPPSLRARFARFLSTCWRPRIQVAIIGVLVGALTHIAWDACTHRTGWVVRMLPALETMLGPLPLYRWLQHGSTAIGIALVALAVVRMPRHVVADVSSRVARVAFVVIPLVVGVGAAVARVLVEVEHGGRVYGHAIAAFVAGTLVGICAASLLVRRIGQSSAALPLALAEREREPTPR